MNAKGLRIGLVGPLPPPSGGMANQTRQLAELLQAEGVAVELIQVNPPYRPSWIGSIRAVRAIFRLIPFLVRLWRAAGRVHLFHVMANSGWAWHLFAAPAVWIATLRRIPVVVNYRGGAAEKFLSRFSFWVRPTMQMADRVVVPSGFLQEVFSRFGLSARIVPNVVDLSRFSPGQLGPGEATRPHLIVTRNLEPIYDIGTAIRAFSTVRKAYPRAHLTVAGSGPEQHNLTKLADSLGLEQHVTFTGRLDNSSIPDLYRKADLLFNPSTVDNMPISILEALASGVPVVSTDAGGIPFMVEHGKTALLVPPRAPDAMALAALQLLGQPAEAARLAKAGLELVKQYSWQQVRGRWMTVYSELVPNVKAVAMADAK